MKLAFNVIVILTSGVFLGVFWRSMNRSRQVATEDRIIYTDAHGAAESSDEVEQGAPTRPPEDEVWLSKFELTERSGELVRSEDLKGQPYVVSFFFSLCPSICVQQNQKLKELQDEFEGQPVKFIAISVDPENDTPEALREYAARFGADPNQWLFLTGELSYIRRVGAEIFRQPVDKQFHTERFALVDPSGAIEGFYNWPEKRQMQKLIESISQMVGQVADHQPGSDSQETL